MKWTSISRHHHPALLAVTATAIMKCCWRMYRANRLSTSRLVLAAMCSLSGGSCCTFSLFATGGSIVHELRKKNAHQQSTFSCFECNDTGILNTSPYLSLPWLYNTLCRVTLFLGITRTLVTHKLAPQNCLWSTYLHTHQLAIPSPTAKSAAPSLRCYIFEQWLSITGMYNEVHGPPTLIVSDAWRGYKVMLFVRI